MRQQINQYIKVWEQRCYSNGLPDEVPKEINDMVPSYRSICIAILKNDLSYIGIEPPASQFYGILKCIELGKQYIKPTRMTQSELRQSVFELINICIAKNCYIKGFGDKFRVMDAEHNPVKNIDKRQMEILKLNNIFVLHGLVWNLRVLANPFQIPLQIELPKND